MVDAPAAPGSPGEAVLSTRSPFTVPQTVERLKRTLEAKALTLFALVDHSAGAHDAGLAMNDTQLLIFGSPQAGTPAMIASPLLALDLPLKVLVWADDQARVWVSYQDPADLASRYGVPEDLMQPLSHVGGLVQTALAS
jgi:uncharacterized protein (DUF302 family)